MPRLGKTGRLFINKLCITSREFIAATLWSFIPAVIAEEANIKASSRFQGQNCSSMMAVPISTAIFCRSHMVPENFTTIGSG